MKQLDTVRKEIGNKVFYIRKFAAFTAANISADLTATLLPLLGGIGPAFSAALNGDDGANTELLNADIATVLPSITSAFSNLSGDKIESLMKRLLIDYRNVSVESDETNGQVQILSYDLANEVFCGETQDMYVLCFEVIKVNYAGFFKKVNARFGGLIEKMKETVQSTTINGANLT